MGMNRTPAERNRIGRDRDAVEKASPTILLADDQVDVRAALRMLMKSAGYRVSEAQTPAEVLACISNEDFAAVLLDMNYQRDTTSGVEGLELVAKLRIQAPQTPIIVMTAWASVELAVEAMQSGAADFIEKPWENTRLLQVLETQIALARSHRNEQRLSAVNTLLLQEIGGDFIVESARMRKVVDELVRIAGSDANVLLLGENGTGKSALAQKIHQWSDRRSQPFIKVNIGGLSPNIFESELFGHVKGAYTDAKSDRPGRFELADGGTLFLDEIGNLPLDLQPKLLRVIEDGEFERLGSPRTQKVAVRTIVATNSDLMAEVRSGRFRQDLYYRINTFQVLIPPLRERAADIIPLARHYLSHAASRYQRPAPRLAAGAERVLLTYAWPGNVRELAHVMERSVLLAAKQCLDAEDLRLESDGTSSDALFDMLTLSQAEAWLLQRALHRHSGNLQRAADQLGITRQSLYRRLEKHGIHLDQDDPSS